jgi:starch phosphorylase
MVSSHAGAEDLRRAADQLAARVPYPLAPLARLAFNYRWSWLADGERLFRAIDPHRWEVCGQNPVRLLQEASTAALERAALDGELGRRAYALEQRVLSELHRPFAAGRIGAERPVAFFCAEFAIHVSLPIYSGGLGVLAGDLLKAASDDGIPMVGVGLLYHQGYFRQRIDTSGWQHEYWVDTDPERLPGALVTTDGRTPVVIRVPIRGRDVAAHVWRIDVGRVPLYLLDTDRPDNRRIDRWITSRLYASDRDTRLAQYALLGLGGIRALRALGIEPSVVHLNEGHASLAVLELTAAAVADGRPFAEALDAARRRTVFTTHTPVPAGNETYAADELLSVHPDIAERLGVDVNTLFGLGRIDPANQSEPIGMTVFGLRVSRGANAVSEQHGRVARAMWRGLFPGQRDDDVPIDHVTNGVHVPTWMAAPMRELLDRHLGAEWSSRMHEPATWAGVDTIPDEAHPKAARLGSADTVWSVGGIRCLRSHTAARCRPSWSASGEFSSAPAPGTTTIPSWHRMVASASRQSACPRRSRSPTTSSVGAVMVASAPPTRCGIGEHATTASTSEPAAASSAAAAPSPTPT